MNNDRENDSFRTSTDIYGGMDTDYNTQYIPFDAEEDFESGGGDAEFGNAPESKKKRKKKRRKKHYMLRLALILAAAAAFVLLLRSPLFDISVIEVEGNQLMSDGEIIKMTGVKEGDNLFSISSRKVKAKLKKNAYIASAGIDRKIPDTYVIKIEEKIPTLAVKYKSKYVILDEEGRAIDYAEDVRGATVLTGVSVSKYEIGEIPAVNDGCDFTALLNMINKVNESGLYFKRIEMLTATSVKANITDTLLCQGECINIAENTEELKAAIYDLGQKQVSRGVINVSGDGYASFNPVIR